MAIDWDQVSSRAAAKDQQFRASKARGDTALRVYQARKAQAEREQQEEEERQAKFNQIHVLSARLEAGNYASDDDMMADKKALLALQTPTSDPMERAKEIDSQWSDLQGNSNPVLSGVGRLANTGKSAAKSYLSNLTDVGRVGAETVSSLADDTKLGTSAKKLAAGLDTAAALFAEDSAADLEKAKEGLGKFGQFGVDVANAGLQMGMDIGLGGLSGTGTLVPMAIRAAGGASREAKNSGATLGEQAVYGAGAGAISVLTEKLSSLSGPLKSAFGEGVADKAVSSIINGITSSNLGKALLTTGASFVGEGLEEVAESVLDTVLQRFVYDDNALKNFTNPDYWQEVGNEFLVGGTLGGLSGAFSGIAGAVQNRAQNRTNVQTQTPPVQTQEETEQAAPPEVEQRKALDVLEAELEEQAEQEQAAPPEVEQRTPLDILEAELEEEAEQAEQAKPPMREFTPQLNEEEESADDDDIDTSEYTRWNPLEQPEQSGFDFERDELGDMQLDENGVPLPVPENVQVQTETGAIDQSAYEEMRQQFAQQLEQMKAERDAAKAQLQEQQKVQQEREQSDLMEQELRRNANAGTATAQSLKASVPGAAVGDSTKTFTSDGKGSVNVQYAVVPLESLIASHDEYGGVNETYPQEFQNRDRTRGTSQMQVSNIAKSLNPYLLMESDTAANGSPIIRADGVVISGNGRTAALQSVYKSGKAEAYRQAVVNNAEKLGISAEEVQQMQNPVLVRVIDSNGVEDMQALSRALNETTVATLTASERGKDDANRLKANADILTLLSVDENGELNLNARENRDFVQNFIGRIVPKTEQASFIDTNGMLSLEGQTRIRNAVFSVAYQDGDLLARVAENNSNDAKRMTNALMEFAGRMARINTDVENQDAFDVEFRKNIIDGVKRFFELRKNAANNFASQTELFEEPSVSEYIARLLSDGKISTGKNTNVSFRSSTKQIVRYLNALADVLESFGSPSNVSMFGDSQNYSMSDVLRFAQQRLANEGAVISGVDMDIPGTETQSAPDVMEEEIAPETQEETAPVEGQTGFNLEEEIAPIKGQEDFDLEEEVSPKAPESQKKTQSENVNEEWDNGRSVGAAEAGFTADKSEPIRQRISNVAKTLTYKSLAELTGATMEQWRNIVQYNVLSNRESVKEAESTLYVIADGKKTFIGDIAPDVLQDILHELSEASAWNAPMTDAAYMLRSEFARKTIAGEMSGADMETYLDMFRQKITATGQGVQANAKYSGAEDPGGYGLEYDTLKRIEDELAKNSDMSPEEAEELRKTIRDYFRQVREIPDAPDAPDTPEPMPKPENPDSPDSPDVRPKPDTEPDTKPEDTEPDNPDNPDNPDIPDVPESLEQLADLAVEIGKERGVFNSVLTNKVSERRANRARKMILNNFTVKEAKEFCYNSIVGLVNDETIVPDLGARIKTFQVLNMLSNPKTVMKNLTGNTSFAAIDTLAMDSAALLDTVFSKVSGTRSIAAQPLSLRQFSRSWRKGFGMAAAEVAFNVNMLNSTTARNVSAKRTFSPDGNLVSRILSRLEEIQGYTMYATDQGQKNATRTSVRERTQALQDEGKIVTPDEDYSVKLADEMADYVTFNDNSRIAVALQTAHDVLNMVLPGIGDSGRTLMGKKVSAFGAGDIAAAFTRVAGNLVSRGLEYSPANVVKGVVDTGRVVAQKAVEGSVDPTLQYKAMSEIGRGTTGTVIAYGFMLLAQAGLLRKAEDEDDPDVAALNASEGMSGTQLNLDAAERWINSDFSESSAQWKNGDTLVDLNNIEPLNLLMALGVEMANIADGNENALEAMWNAETNAFMSASADLPVLQFIGNSATDIIKYNQDPRQVLAQEAASTIASSMVPNIVTQYAKATDDRPRSTYSSDDWIDNIVDGLKIKIPGQRENLPGSVDTFGKERRYQGSDSKRMFDAMFNPIGVNTYQQSHVSKELQRLRVDTSDTSAYPSKSIPKSFSYTDAAKVKHEVAMSYEQRQAYQKVRGQTTYSTMADMMKTSYYQNADSEKQIALLNLCGEYASQMARVSVAQSDDAAESWALSARDGALGLSPAEFIAVKDEFPYLIEYALDKTAVALDVGLTFAQAQDLLHDAKYRVGDANGYFKEEEAVAYLDSLGLSTRQKAALFPLVNSAKHNPYN